MISWATKYDSIGEYSDVVPETCKICSEKTKPVYKVEQAYFKLYGLALFPTKKLYFKTCPACNTRLKVKATDTNLNTVKRYVTGKIKFKYVWGWLILLPIILLALFLIASIKNMN